MRLTKTYKILIHKRDGNKLPVDKYVIMLQIGLICFGYGLMESLVCTVMYIRVP